MRSPICHLGDISETRRTSIPAGRATNDSMREYETNDNNVVKGSHVADTGPPTLQIPREITLAIARSPSGNPSLVTQEIIYVVLINSVALVSKVLIHHLQFI